LKDLLPVLARIATARPDTITTPELREILTDMGLPLERAKTEPRTAPIYEEKSAFKMGYKRT